jgi:hypothetical protein
MIYDKILYRELDELPTLAQGQADDLKIDTRQLSIAVNLPEGVDGINVWCSRVEPSHPACAKPMTSSWPWPPRGPMVCCPNRARDGARLALAGRMPPGHGTMSGTEIGDSNAYHR